jgi:hypothetical protein
MHLGAHKKYKEVIGEGYGEDGNLERPEVSSDDVWLNEY